MKEFPKKEVSHILNYFDATPAQKKIDIINKDFEETIFSFYRLINNLLKENSISSLEPRIDIEKLDNIFRDLENLKVRIQTMNCKDNISSFEFKHCAKTWYSIDLECAMEDIVNGDFVKCDYNGKEYFFNLPNSVNYPITDTLIKNGEWSVYTWAD